MDTEKRRAVFQTVRDKAHALGLKFEDDPVFQQSIEEWISGKINAADFREVYLTLLADREKAERIRHFVKHCLT